MIPVFIIILCFYFLNNCFDFSYRKRKHQPEVHGWGERLGDLYRGLPAGAFRQWGSTSWRCSHLQDGALVCSPGWVQPGLWGAQHGGVSLLREGSDGGVLVRLHSRGASGEWGPPPPLPATCLGDRRHQPSGRPLGQISRWAAVRCTCLFILLVFFRHKSICQRSQKRNVAKQTYNLRPCEGQEHFELVWAAEMEKYDHFTVFTLYWKVMNTWCKTHM